MIKCRCQAYLRGPTEEENSAIRRDSCRWTQMEVCTSGPFYLHQSVLLSFLIAPSRVHTAHACRFREKPLGLVAGFTLLPAACVPVHRRNQRLSLAVVLLLVESQQGPTDPQVGQHILHLVCEAFFTVPVCCTHCSVASCSIGTSFSFFEYFSWCVFTVCVCVRACVCACMCACVRVRVCVHTCS